MKEFWRAVVKNYSKNQIICPLNHRKTTSEFSVQRIMTHFGLDFVWWLRKVKFLAHFFVRFYSRKSVKFSNFEQKKIGLLKFENPPDWKFLILTDRHRTVNPDKIRTALYVDVCFWCVDGDISENFRPIFFEIWKFYTFSVWSLKSTIFSS